MDYYAIGQCTPGVIAVNVATFIGYKIAGIIGGIIATLGVITPSVIIITLITSVSAILSNIIKNKPVVKQTCFSLLSMQILVKRSFLYTCQLGNITDSVLTGLVELHCFANSITVDWLTSAFTPSRTSGG